MSDWLFPRTGHPLLPSRQKSCTSGGKPAPYTASGRTTESTNAETVAAMAAAQYPARGEIENQERRKCFQCRCRTDEHAGDDCRTQRQLPGCAGEQGQQQRVHVLVLEVGLRGQQNRDERREEHREPGTGGETHSDAYGIPRLHAQPHTSAETHEVERVPEESCRHRAPGGDRRERRKEERLEWRTDEAIGSAAAGVERLGVEKAPAALEEDRGVAAFVDGVDRADDREEQREKREQPGPGARGGAHHAVVECMTAAVSRDERHPIS